jgi:hypothetical protein
MAKSKTKKENQEITQEVSQEKKDYLAEYYIQRVGKDYFIKYQHDKKITKPTGEDIVAAIKIADENNITNSIEFKGNTERLSIEFKDENEKILFFEQWVKSQFN